MALGLVTERFAATLKDDGHRTAISRTLVTMIEACVITFLATTLHGADPLTTHPELLLVQIWSVVFLSRYLALRFLEHGAAAMIAGHRKPVPTRARPSKAPTVAAATNHPS